MECGFVLYNLYIVMTGEVTEKNSKYDFRREGMSCNNICKLNRAKVELIAKEQCGPVYMLLSRQAMLNTEGVFNTTGFSKK